MRLISLLALLFLVLSPTAFAQEFERWEGKQRVYEGEGGTRKTVDGVDFWSNGSPPRKFILVGYIYDRRHKTGIIGAISMDNLFSDIAEVVKREGGDAVIVLSAQTEDTGTVSSGNFFTPPAGGNTWGTATTAKVQKQITRCAVIKYMPDDTPVTPPSPPPQMPPGVPAQ